MAADCPTHPDGHACSFTEPVGHKEHGYYDGQEWIFWVTPPVVSPKIGQRRKPSDEDITKKIEAIENTDPVRMAVAGAPETSHAAAKHAAIRSGSQKHRLLVAYAGNPKGLTDEEAAEITGMLGQHGCCWWARSCDLRDEGRISDTGQTRVSPRTQEERMVCVITEYGMASL